MVCRTFLLLILLLFNVVTVLSKPVTYVLSGVVRDASNGELLSFATIQLTDAVKVSYTTISDNNGRYHFAGLPPGEYTAIISYLGYDQLIRNFSFSKNFILNFDLSSSATALNEVVVTASESRGLTSASKIDRTAMAHLQPTSFTDLLELLPGGKSVDPNMGSANLIRIREGGTTSRSIASLGVGFVVDGMPVNTDGNLQYIPGTSLGAKKESVSQGVDMRMLSTDNIESVEIVRGIPSVEYGNLTGGLVLIKRKQTAAPFTARFKADQVGKLFSVGKGVGIGGNNILNLDLNYLDSKVDPRDSRENYKRITVSSRWNASRKMNLGRFDWNLNADYTGSFDNVKQDKDVTIKEDKYKSTYDKFSMGGEGILKFTEHSFIRQLRATISFSQEISRIEERKSVSIDRPMGIPNSMVEGESDGLYLPYSYIADMTIDGKPFYANARLNGDFAYRWLNSSHRLKVGVEWNMSKNYGEGRVYDVARPLNTASTTRPRSYKEIPSLQNFSLYAEEQMTLPIGKHEFLLAVGARTTSLLGLEDAYTLKGKLFVDPRINMQWRFPALGVNNDWFIDLSGGIGWLSKMPTTAQLYPDASYVDITQLNYYHSNPDFRRINLMTYKWDNANYDLRPARNRKWEMRLNVSHKGNMLSVTYFREKMKNAFNDISYYRTLAYKRYDASSVNSSALTGPPALEDMVYKADTLINAYSMSGNGMQVRKQGVEFQFSSRRIEKLKTRITITGAWYQSTYSDIAPRYIGSSILLGGEQLKYIGLYDWEDGTTKEQFNTNFTADTYLNRIGMIFSLTAQCTWYTSTRNLWNDGTPLSYIDKSGTVHPFTEADKANIQLKHLVKTYSDAYFDRTSVPFAMDINLKATKEIGRFMSVSLFVNRLLNVSPDYKNGTALIRRVSSPYFGMEANFTF